MIGGEADGWGGKAELAELADPATSSLQGTVAGALVEVADEYILRSGEGVPAEAARRHEGATAPAWLLAVAIVRPRGPDLVADTLELATAAGVPRRSLGACVAYVELAAGLFAALPAEQAVRSAAGGMVSVDLVAVADPERAAPPLCGDSTVDALSAGAWALLQEASSAEVMAVVGQMSTPGVAAAVAGLLGLRDGCGALPFRWHQGGGSAAVCDALAPGLVRSRCQGQVYANTGKRREREPASSAPGCNKSSAGTAESGVEPVERGGRPEAADALTPTGCTRPRDRALEPASLARADVGVIAGDHVEVGVGVSAGAITEETEAIEEHYPATMEEQSSANGTVGVWNPDETPADEWVGRSTPWRQLEGVAVR